MTRRTVYMKQQGGSWDNQNSSSWRWPPPLTQAPPVGMRPGRIPGGVLGPAAFHMHLPLLLACSWPWGRRPRAFPGGQGASGHTPVPAGRAQNFISQRTYKRAFHVDGRSTLVSTR